VNIIREEDITLDDIKEEMSGMLDYWEIQLDRYIENSIKDRIREIEGKAYDKGYEDGYELAELTYKNKAKRKGVKL
jgi:hypothetical protein